MLSNDVLTKIRVAQHKNPDNCLREMLAKRLEAGDMCLSTVDRKDVAEEWRKGTHTLMHHNFFTAIASYKYQNNHYVTAL